jgi:hypothetical protein
MYFFKFNFTLCCTRCCTKLRIILLLHPRHVPRKHVVDWPGPFHQSRTSLTGTIRLAISISEFFRMSKAEILNKAFEVISYDGGMEKDNQKYKIDNILKFSGFPHCSKEGNNFILTLEYTGEDVFTLSNFAIRGGENCSSPAKSGLVFISNSKFDPKSIEKYKDFTSIQFNALSHSSPDEPVVFFETSDSSGEFQTQVWATGKYVAILFIDAWNENFNIDVQHVVFYGFHGKQSKIVNWGDIDDSLGVTFPSFKHFNPLHDTYAKHFMTKPNCVIYSNSPKELEFVDKIAKQYADKFNFFYSPFHVHGPGCSHEHHGHDHHHGEHVHGPNCNHGHDDDEIEEDEEEEHVHGPNCNHDHDEEDDIEEDDEEEEDIEEEEEEAGNMTELAELVVSMVGIKTFPAVVMFSGDMKSKSVLNKEITGESVESFVSDFDKGVYENFVKSANRVPNDVLPEFPHAKQVTAERL